MAERATSAPAWLTVDATVDHQIGLLKTGKEAEVLLIERRQANGTERILLAHKRYRPMNVRKGDLEAGGFSKARAFTTDHRYRDGRGRSSTRDARAVSGKSAHGRQVLAREWVAHEVRSLQLANELGVTVPYVVEADDEGIVMQLIGDEAGAAPRLVDARLGPADAELAYAQLREELALMTRGGLVHADLSPYNVLWWHDRVWIIDLPQAVDLTTNPNALDLLHHDVVTLAAWCNRHGAPVDPEAWFAELVAEAFHS